MNIVQYFTKALTFVTHISFCLKSLSEVCTDLFFIEFYNMTIMNLILSSVNFSFQIIEEFFIHGMSIIGKFTPSLDLSTFVPKIIVSTESLFQIGIIKTKDHGKQETTFNMKFQNLKNVICKENNNFLFFQSFNWLVKPNQPL